MRDPLCYNPFNLVFVDFDESRWRNDINDVSDRPSFSPCCIYRHDLGGNFDQPDGTVSTSIKDYLSSPQLVQLKQHMLTQDQLPEACIGCQVKEQSGNISYRKIYRHNIEFQDQLRYVDLSLDNQCNMACFMCSPTTSTTLAQEYVALGWFNQVKKLNTYNLLDDLRSLPNGIQLNLTGGEPFMSQHFSDLMDIVLEKDWAVAISTNCSLLNQKALNQLKSCRSLKITASMDGTEQLYEIMRWPNTWDKFQEVFGLLKSAVDQIHPLHLDLIKGEPLSRQQMNINAVLQVLNIKALPNIARWARQQGVYLRLTSIIYSRDWLGWCILDSGEKETLVKYLEDQIKDRASYYMYQHKEIRGWCKEISSTEFSLAGRQKFLDRIPKILKHRSVAIESITQHLDWAPNLALELSERYYDL